MTIAELQLGRMRPQRNERNLLTERARATRTRRFNLMVLMAAWASIWVYGLGRFYTAADLAEGLDRFLPLQVIAALAAVAAILGARRRPVSGWPRWLPSVPAMLTGAGSLALVWVVAAGGQTSAADTRAESEPLHGHAPIAIETVSL